MEERLAIPADPRRLGDARDFVDAVAERSGFDGEARYQIIMAANEAISNAIEHGTPCDGGTLHLSAAAEGGALVLSVRDCGEFPLSGTPAPDPIAERGRGFAFMNLLMDDVRLETGPGATTVRLAKRMATPDAPDAVEGAEANEERRRSADNRAVVERVMAAFDRREVDAVFEDVDLGVMFEPLSTPVRSRTPYLGRAGLRRYFDELGDTWEEFSVTIGELRTRGDHVVALARIRGRQGDAVVEADAGIVWRVRDGKVVWGKTYATPGEALEAGGLAPDDPGH